MKDQNGITKFELIVIIVIAIILLIYILLPKIHRHPKLPARLVCGTNVKGLGTACFVYGHDYDGKSPALPGKGPWSKKLGFDYYNPAPDFTEGGREEYTSRTITASWYLLVRQVDVPPASFICKSSNQEGFKGENPADKDLIKLWDFGPDPHRHVSYAMQNPYGKFPAGSDLPGNFAVAADMNPWFKDGDFIPPATDQNPPQLINPSIKDSLKLGNSTHHKYEGQNVLYIDGSARFERKPNCAVNNDNIYTYWPTAENPTENNIQTGQNPTKRNKQNDSKSNEDSFLAI